MSSCTIKQCLIESDPADPPHERGQTVISLVMWASPGPPCEGEYIPYRL